MNKLVIRLMDGDPAAAEHGNMLGWQETLCYARGDGQIWAGQTVIVPVEVAGTARYVSVHWADVNVEIRLPIDGHAVRVGDLVTVLQFETPIFRVGPQAGGLPGVTTRAPISLNVRSAGLGFEGNR